jgi:hypothetical protein
MGAP